MKNKIITINNWGILNLFINYLKRNRAIIISMFLLPLIFIGAISLNYKIVQNNNNAGLIIMLLWLIESSSFAIQTFLSILLDFKQSVIYRRIGLTRIKKINFFIMASIFNLTLMMISNLFIFLTVIIILASFKLTAIISTIFQWQFLIILLFTIACLILLTSIAIIMSVFIKTRTGQTIASLIVNFLIIIPLFALIILLDTISANTKETIINIGVGGVIGIFAGIFIFINLISVLLYYLSWKYFKWYD